MPIPKHIKIFLWLFGALVTAVCILYTSLTVLAIRSNNSLTKLNAVLTDADATTKQAQVLVKNSQYLVLQAGVTMNQVRLESLKEGVVLDQTNKQVNRVLTDLDTFVTTSTRGESTLLASANDRVTEVKPVIEEADAAMQETTKAIAGLQEATVGLNKLIADPSIPATLKAVQKSSEATATTMANVSDTSTDVKTYVHHLLHPSWVRSVANWSLKIGKVFAP